MRHEMRRLVTLAIIIIAVAVHAIVGPPAALADQVVVPTGQFPADVTNVQAAVNVGGTVLLKATNAAGQPTAFDFGPPQPVGLPRSVSITRDVAIFGEVVGDQMTTISGGSSHFVAVAPVRLHIEGIHFVRPVFRAIGVFASTGADIIGNRFTDVLGSGTSGQGILVSGAAVRGHIRVADNLIEDFHADRADGIVVFAVAADVEITGNRIHTVQASGMFFSDNTGLVTIEDNVIVPGPGDPAPQFSFGNGLTIFNRGVGRFLVRRNTAVCENVFADGIYIFDFGTGPGQTGDASHVIEKNDVVMHDSIFGGITLNGGARIHVGQNRVSGTGAFALDAIAFPDLLVQSSTFQGNNISGFVASVADVFFDEFTTDLVLVGSSGIAVDLGVNNRITGLTKIGHAEHIGPQISEAQARKHELIRAASQAGGE